LHIFSLNTVGFHHRMTPRKNASLRMKETELEGVVVSWNEYRATETDFMKPNKHHTVEILSLCLACCLLGSCNSLEVVAPPVIIGPAATDPNAVAGLTATPGTESDATSPSAVPDTGPLNLSINSAVLLGLENNRSLLVQRFNPQIKSTQEQQALSVFDPILSGQIANRQSRNNEAPVRSRLTTQTNSADIGLTQYFPSGTSLGIFGSTEIDERSSVGEYGTRLGLSANQPLLRGFGSEVNLASVNQARLDTRISEYELRGYVLTLVTQIEEMYWSYILAERKIEIYTQSLDLAQKQLNETQERIQVGDLGASERAAAQAEVALRKEDLIDARNALALIRLTLLRLMNPPGANLWDRQVQLISPPTGSPDELSPVESYIAAALEMRPDLNQARLLLQRNELEVVKTRNGLLPKLDLFVTLGKTGYADSFGRTVGSLHQDNFDVLAGLTYEFPPLNRAARAANLRAVLSRQQAREAIWNLTQLAQVDVRAAYLEILRNREQVIATAATRALQEEKVRVETEKFRVGKSTSLLVAQAQRDLVVSQISEIETVVNGKRAWVLLYNLDGSLLQRRGIVSPGRQTVRLPDLP
jgi:outer membrane protein